jgi:hypothetical protein
MNDLGIGARCIARGAQGDCLPSLAIRPPSPLTHARLQVGVICSSVVCTDRIFSSPQLYLLPGQRCDPEIQRRRGHPRVLHAAGALLQPRVVPPLQALLRGGRRRLRVAAGSTPHQALAHGPASASRSPPVSFPPLVSPPPPALPPPTPVSPRLPFHTTSQGDPQSPPLP